MQNQFSARLDASESISGFGYFSFVADVRHVGFLLCIATTQSDGSAFTDVLISSTSGV